MTKKYCKGIVPAIAVDDVSLEHPLKSIAENLAATVAESYESLAFSQACEKIFDLIRAGNKYIDEKAPWSLYKQGQQSAVEEVLYTVLESVRLAAYLLSPIIPQISSAIYQQLGFSIDFSQTVIDESVDLAHHGIWGVLPGQQKLEKAKPVFQKLERLEAKSV
jgi:methionyl-tRNA synthetase